MFLAELKKSGCIVLKNTTAHISVLLLLSGHLQVVFKILVLQFFTIHLKFLPFLI